MWRTQKTSIPVSSAMARLRSIRDAGTPSPMRLTMAICGSAALALAMVLGSSLTFDAVNAPIAEGGGVVYLVNRSPAMIREPAAVDIKGLFVGGNCNATAAVH